MGNPSYSRSESRIGRRFSFCLAILLFSAPVVAERPVATVAVVNAKVWTGDKQLPEAEAVAVFQNVVLAVGNNEDIRALAGPATRVIDAGGRRVVPGLGDAHLHLLMGALQLRQVQLKDAKDSADFSQRLTTFAAGLPKGRWILGGNWDHDRAFAGQLPTARILDEAVPDHYVLIDRYDGHMALVNSQTLQLAGITSKTPDPPGGVIVRDQMGEPTGVLRDAAMDLVSRLVPEPTESEVAEAVVAGLAELRQSGVTMIDDLGGSSRDVRRGVLRLYQRLARAGKLTCRIDAALPIADHDRLAELGVEAGLGSALIRLGSLKGFIDGSLGSSTAKFFEPYLHEPSNAGVFVTAPDRLRQQMLAADTAGLGLCIHAIGDEGNAKVLDLFAALEVRNRPRPFRIEHAQHVRPADFARFARLHVVASMQPYHAIDDGRWAEGRIGAKRCASSYAFRSMLDAGAVLAFGSDWPVAPISPLLGIDAAVNRKTVDGKHPSGWFPEQSISVAEALEAYTMGVARARGQEDQLGSISAGRFADMVILTRDILDPAQREHIAEAAVQTTIFDGHVVFEQAERQ